MSDTPVSLFDRLCENPQDAASWRRWCDLYVPLIRRWVHPDGLQPHDTDEVIQEVLVVVVRELPQFRHSGHRGAFRSWLRTVLAHRLQSLWASRTAQLGSVGADAITLLAQLEDPNSSLSHLWDQEHDKYVTRRLLELIEPDFEAVTWQAFRRLVLDGAATGDVAAELGITPNAVRIAKSRVLKRLREESAGLVD
jgi:RNA polymerase sigma-70 factor (ECF subfamily)